MRIKQLDLIKYGKFDGEVLSFPAAVQDFHVIVGPNEAGKSTVRNAVRELLFGMPLKTPLAFLHDLKELRLGGIITSESRETVFHRARGRSPLRTLNDEILADDFLSPFLGGATKEFFEQMFGLDHQRLVEGGQSILDASKDLGRVLFQSAAGIGSFGPVREALDTRASELWTRRGSTTEYALAEARFIKAGVEFKTANVRTKAWSEAKASLEQINDEIEETNKTHLRLETLRSKLERVRRLAPYLRELAAKEGELTDLGDVIDMPPTSYMDLTSGQANLAAATRVLEERRKDLEDRQREQDAITTDDEVLTLSTDIEALTLARAACVNHARDLLLRQAEVERLLHEASEAASQLGWSTDEGTLRASLPSMLALKTVTNLLRDHGVLRQSKISARESAEEKEQDLKNLRAQLDDFSVSEISDELRQALSEAQTLKNSRLKQRSLKTDLEDAEQMLDDTLTALGRWRLSVVDLRTMELPSPSRIALLQRQEQEHMNSIESARVKVQEALAYEARLQLEEKNFTEGHKVVTASDVRNARLERDGVWSNVKTGAVTLEAGAPEVDVAIRLADELVDSQLATATEAATLQNIRQQAELARADVSRYQDTLQEQEAELSHFREEWDALTASARLPGITPVDLPEWLRKREAVFAAEANSRQRKRDIEAEETVYRESTSALTQALNVASVVVSDPSDLASLTSTAANFVRNIDLARAKKESLEEQVVNAERALKALAAKSENASGAYADWESEWQKAIQAAKLNAASTTIAQAEGAVELANTIADKLDAAEDIRRNRIKAMQTDLSAVKTEARRISNLLKDQLPVNSDWFEVARLLMVRLSAASNSALAAKRAEDALRECNVRKEEAELEVADTEARIQPLLRLGRVETVEQALPLADRSNRRRQLLNSIDQARSALFAEGDGLTREAIEAEAMEHDPADVIGLLDQVKRDLATVNSQLTSLAQRQVSAQQTFSAINGDANAATAEAKRQESLAAMGDTAEQYIEMATASRLLKWAIDRYRDRKQGPMLQRAGEIFSVLTIGHFTKLVVDHEIDPPALYAKRKNGKQVEVPGLSEGTRDQLFLALRIAAIELHLQHAIALPFIADDLFVNFDDGRAKAGLEALRELSNSTQVVFLTHHKHLLPLVREVFGNTVNIVELQRETEGA